MDSDRIDRLIDDYLHGTLSAQDKGEFEAALVADPRVARELLAAVADEAMIRELMRGKEKLRAAPVAAEDSVARPEAQASTETARRAAARSSRRIRAIRLRPRREGSPRWALWTAGLAASALIGFGILSSKRDPVEPPAATAGSPAKPPAPLVAERPAGAEPSAATLRPEVRPAPTSEPISKPAEPVKPSDPVEPPAVAAAPEPVKLPPDLKAPGSESEASTPAVPPVEAAAVPPAPSPAPVVAPVPPSPAVVEGTALARLEEVEGTVSRLVGADVVAAKGGDPLLAGHGIQSGGASSRVVLALADETRLEMGPDTRIRSVEELSGRAGRGRQVNLDRGFLTAEVARLPAGRTLLFMTPHAEVRVVGTRLTLGVTDGLTRVDAKEGKVQVRRLQDGKTASLVAGQYIVAGMGGAFKGLPARATAGLQAAYAFNEGRGKIVRDVSKVAPAVDLVIDDDAAVRWIPGGLSVRAPTRVMSAGPAAKIAQACKATDELTVEAWVRPGRADQQGTLIGMIERLAPQGWNFQMGQGILNDTPDRYGMCLNLCNPNDEKKVMTTHGRSLELRRIHLVFTRSAKDIPRFYIDSVEKSKGILTGDFACWREDLRLSLASDGDKSAPWLGDFHFLAIYNAALTPEQVQQHFRAGPD